MGREFDPPSMLQDVFSRSDGFGVFFKRSVCEYLEIGDYFNLAVANLSLVGTTFEAHLTLIAEPNREDPLPPRWPPYHLEDPNMPFLYGCPPVYVKKFIRPLVKLKNFCDRRRSRAHSLTISIEMRGIDVHNQNATFANMYRGVTWLQALDELLECCGRDLDKFEFRYNNTNTVPHNDILRSLAQHCRALTVLNLPQDDQGRPPAFRMCVNKNWEPLDLSILSNLKLEELDLSGYVGDFSAIDFSSMKKFAVGWGPYSDARQNIVDIEPLRNAKKLSTLSLQVCNTIDLSPLFTCIALQQLFLLNCDLSGTTSLWSKLINLQKLYLARVMNMDFQAHECKEIFPECFKELHMKRKGVIPIDNSHPENFCLVYKA